MRFACQCVIHAITQEQLLSILLNFTTIAEHDITRNFRRSDFEKKNLVQGGGKEHFGGLSILSVPFSKTALRISLFFVLNIDQYTTNHMVSAPPQFNGEAKHFWENFQGGTWKISKNQGGAKCQGGAEFSGGSERFLPKSQLNILKSMINIDTSTISMQFDPENI